MKDIRELHRKAMDFAKQAETARLEGDAALSRTALEQAFQFEKEAAEDLANEPEAEPTRGVLFRSAASLALQLGRYEEALKLADAGLAGKPSPEIESELSDLRQQIAEKIDWPAVEKMQLTR